MSMLPSAPVIILLLGLAAVVAINILISKHDKHEPPIAPGALPVIGHALGLLQDRYDFYLNVSKKTVGPIFTIYLPGQKLYVVKKIELIQKVEKTKGLSWQHVVNKIMAAMGGWSQEAVEIAMRDPTSEQSLQNASSHAFTRGTQPGENLDAINEIMVKDLSTSLDHVCSTELSEPVKLCAWVRGILSQATTESVYGKSNPYANQQVIDAYWEVDRNVIPLILLPSFLTRGAIKARTTIIHAFENYFRNAGHEHGSPLMKLRYAVEREQGLSFEDMARAEISASVAFLANTALTSFWLLLHIYADTDLLAKIHAEVDAITTHEPTEIHHIKPTRNIDLSNLNTRCKLLASAMQEVLRCTSLSSSIREVLSDIILDGKWLLKKGAMVLMPGRIIHMDPAIWVDDVQHFTPDRFLKRNDVKAIPGRCIRTFGGGDSRCPGKFFALNEVMAFVGLFVARYDISPADGRPWEIPTSWKTKMSAVIAEPDWDVEVIITERSAFQDSKWTLSLTTTKNALNIASEDQMAAT